jgi:hypothetical protein
MTDKTRMAQRRFPEVFGRLPQPVRLLSNVGVKRAAE